MLYVLALLQLKFNYKQCSKYLFYNNLKVFVTETMRIKCDNDLRPNRFWSQLTTVEQNSNEIRHVLKQCVCMTSGFYSLVFTEFQKQDLNYTFLGVQVQGHMSTDKQHVRMT